MEWIIDYSLRHNLGTEEDTFNAGISAIQQILREAKLGRINIVKCPEADTLFRDRT